MEILDTLVSREIAAIGNSKEPSTIHQWDVTIKANGRNIKPTYVKDIKLDRLYHQNYTDEIRITLGIVFGEYQYNVLPYKDALEITVVKVPMGIKAQPQVNKSRNRNIAVFKAQILNGNSTAIAGDHPLTLNKAMAGKGEITDITFQLFNPVIDNIRKKTFGTVFRDTSPLDAVCFTLMKHSSVPGAEVAHQVKGIHIDPTFNNITRNHIVVPHNTPVTQVPEYIDNIVGGLHPAQMRYYLQGSHWYLYPIFDDSRFHQNPKSLTIVKIPKHRLPGIERTFRREGSQVIVLSTRGTTHQDSSESNQLNDGNGVRFADARKIMNDVVKLGLNKVISNLTENLTEVVYEHRKDEKDMVMGGDKLITDKYNREYAKLALKSGAYIQTIWEHAEPELLYPGMPVRYIFQDGDKTKELYGTLNAVETLDYNTNNTITDARFATMALLTFFVSNKSPMRKDIPGTQVSVTRST